MNLRGTKWRHKRSEKQRGTITFHRPRTGRIAFERKDKTIWRGTLETLRKNWEQVE